MDRSLLVNTKLGVAAQWARDKYSLWRTASGSMEALGTFANAVIGKQLLERLCAGDKVFVDVGAHIGSVIDGVMRGSRPAHIFAFEAIPGKAARLKQRFPDVTVIDCAVGEANGRLPFFIDHDQSGYSSLLAKEPGSTANVEEIVVDVRPLDEMISRDDVDLIKIDVEGAELGVLMGGSRLIRRCAPVIIFESGPGEMGSYTKKNMWRWFDEAGYAVLVPNRVAHFDDGLSEDGFIESHLYPRRTTDYVAVPRQRRSEIRARARSILRLGDQ